MKVKCIKDVDMYSNNTDGKRVRTGVTAFIDGHEYKVAGENLLINHQGDSHYWDFKSEIFTEYFITL